MVFAKDTDKVGDLTAFEGKTVALTGRIELSPDGKPQIIIRSSDQVKLAGPADDQVKYRLRVARGRGHLFQYINGG